MRYFKIILACFGFIFTVVGATVGVMFWTGKFDKEIIQPENIAFDITEKLTEDDFEVVLSTTTENVTEKDVTLSLTNQTESEIDGKKHITDGVITVPKVVQLGTPFSVQVNKTTYEGVDEEWNVGGTSVIRAKSTNPLIQEAAPLTVEVDIPVFSLAVDIVSTTGTELGTVAAKDVKGLMKTLAEGEENKQVVDLAVGSVVRLKPVFTPTKSAKTTKGEDRKVIFEIPSEWRGSYIDFVEGENDLIEILRQTTVENIKINAYCFRTSADEYAAKSEGYSDDELITMMNANGVSGESLKIFGTNQKITGFTSSKSTEQINLAINSPLTLVANGTIDGAFDLGLELTQDAGVAHLEDKLAFIKLSAYWQNGEDWEDADDKLLVVGQTSSEIENGVKAKINKKDANLSSWKVIASEAGNYKLVAKLSYEYFSSSSSTSTTIEFEVEYGNILVSSPVSSGVKWKESISDNNQLIILSSNNSSMPTKNLLDFVEVSKNSTYREVRFFASPSDNEKVLTEIINCKQYETIGDKTYYEIQDGILTAKAAGKFQIYFATILTDYLGKPKLDSKGKYMFDESSQPANFEVIESLETLSASISINDDVLNKNTDENTKEHVFHVRQQQNNIFELTLSFDSIENFERDYLDGKIHIDFVDAYGQQSNILKLSDSYTKDEDNVTFTIDVGELENDSEPTLKCRISYDIDPSLTTFAKNDGGEVSIKVLKGNVTYISFDAVKGENPKNSADNPIIVELDFSDTAAGVKYTFTFNENELDNNNNELLKDLLKTSVNADAINKSIEFSSSNKNVVDVVEENDTRKLAISGATADTNIVITARAMDNSGVESKLYFKVLKSKQITLSKKNDSNVSVNEDTNEIEIEGYAGNEIDFKNVFEAKAIGPELGKYDRIDNLITYSIEDYDSDHFGFANNTLTVRVTLGQQANFKLYAKTDFGYSKMYSVTVKEGVSCSATLAGDPELSNVSTSEVGTKVYAGQTIEIPFEVIKKYSQDTTTDVSFATFNFDKSNGPINILEYVNNNILKVTFGDVDKPTSAKITFKGEFVVSDKYPCVHSMSFVVFPNVEVALSSEFGTENNPASYENDKTVILHNEDTGLIKLKRIKGNKSFDGSLKLAAKINGAWQELSSNDGKYMLPSSYRATDGGFVEIRVTYAGCVLDPVEIWLNPQFDLEKDDVDLTKRVLYGGKQYFPFVAYANDGISLPNAGNNGYSYTLSSTDGQKYLQIENGKITKISTQDFSKIVTTQKLIVENANGKKEIPIIILPIAYPFVAYDSIESFVGDDYEDMTKGIDIKDVLESEDLFDTLEAGTESEINLSEKIKSSTPNPSFSIVEGADCVNFDGNTITAKSVGKDKIVKVQVSYSIGYDKTFSFNYRIKIVADQEILVFYPYHPYDGEEYENYGVEKDGETFDADTDVFEHQYFDGKSQIAVDLLEKFNPKYTPNNQVLTEKFGDKHAKRFVVVSKSGKKAISDQNLSFDIQKVYVGGEPIEVGNQRQYAEISQNLDTQGNVTSAKLLINKKSTESTIIVVVKASTQSGATAFYRFRADSSHFDYAVTYDGTTVAEGDEIISARSQIDLADTIKVKVGNPQNDVRDYNFHISVPEGAEDKITLSGNTLGTKFISEDTQTTLVVYDKYGKIIEFTLTLKCTIEHEIKSSTIGTDATYDIKENILFFNTQNKIENYSMTETKTTLFVRDHLNNIVGAGDEKSNLYREIGGYSVEDITSQYTQYVILNNTKHLGINLIDSWKGEFVTGADANINITYQSPDTPYITINKVKYERMHEGDGTYYFEIPIYQSSTEKIKFYVEDGAGSIKIPYFSFKEQGTGIDNRQFVLFDRVTIDDASAAGATQYVPYGANELDNEKSRQTCVYVPISGNYICYNIKNVGTNDTPKLHADMLAIVDGDKTTVAEVDENGHAFIKDSSDEKHYFTRFYQIKYSGLSEYALDKDGKEIEIESKKVNNVPYIRYMISKGDYGVVADVKDGKLTIDLSKVLFFTKNDESKISTLTGEKDNFKFYFKGEDEEKEIEFEEDGISFKIDKEMKTISIVIKDSSGRHVVGRFNLVPTIETSTDTSSNNVNVFIEAGDTNQIDYQMVGTIELDNYKGAMSKIEGNKDFTGNLTTDFGSGTLWTNYAYEISSNKYKDENNKPTISIDEGGTISKIDGKEPWGDITVSARLQYKPTEKTLAKDLVFADWIEAVLGEDTTFSTYEGLKGLLGSDYRVVVADNEYVIDGEGNIKDVPYGSTIKLLLQQKCQKCDTFVTVGEKHSCWISGSQTTISDIGGFDDEQKQTLSTGGSVEIVAEGGQTKDVYALSEGATLKKDSTTGEWTLTGSIAKTTYENHTFKASFSKAIPQVDTITINKGETTVTTARLNLSDGNDFKVLAKALFGEDATKILDYSTWNGVLAECGVEWTGYDSSDYTFGGKKDIDLTLTKKIEVSTGTFYVVNQEAGKLTIHATGNLNKLELENLKFEDYTANNNDKIDSVVKVEVEGDGNEQIWVLPLETKKYLKQGKLAETIKEKFGLNAGQFTYRRDDEQNTEQNTEQNKDINGIVATPIKTSKEKLSNPFTTITVFQHDELGNGNNGGYAIGKIHIYLEDYSGDKSYESLGIITKTLTDSEISGERGTISSDEGFETFTKEQDATLKFVVGEEDSNKLLTTTLNWKENIEGQNVQKVHYLTQKAQMNGNEFLFSNGLKVIFDDDDDDIKLQMIGQTSAEFEFVVDEKTFKFEIKATDMSSSSVVSEELSKDETTKTTNYFEGLEDIVTQPTSASKNDGEKIYRAEKTTKFDDGAKEYEDVGFRDRIDGKDFGYDEWTFDIKYKDQKGNDVEVVDKKIDEITINDIGDDVEVTITVNNIKVDNGEFDSISNYTFVVTLHKNPPVTVIGGVGGTTSEVDGGIIVSTQSKEINLSGSDSTSIFKINAEPRTINVGENVDSWKTDEDEKDKQIVKALFEKGELSHLKGTSGSSTSTLFRTKRADDKSVVYIVFDNVEYVIESTNDGYKLKDKNGQEVPGDFTLELNKDLYKFETGEGIGENITRTVKITPIFSFRYSIGTTNLFTFEKKTEGGWTSVGQNQEIGDKIKITADAVQSDRETTIVFNAFRGKGESATLVATANYKLTIKPSIVATLNYPTIKYVDQTNGQTKEFTDTVEHFHADGGNNELDMTKSSALSTGKDARIVITKSAFGKAVKNGEEKDCEVKYEIDSGRNVTISEIKIDGATSSCCTSCTLTEDPENSGNYSCACLSCGCKISLFIPEITLTYRASVKNVQQKIKINGELAVENNIIKSIEKKDGKFKFDLSGLSQADVTISVVATIDKKDFILGQYGLTVYKDPVILLNSTYEHLENGNEVIPIDGSTEIKLFGNDVNTPSGSVPRVQFEYDNKILDINTYKDDIWAQDIATIGITNNTFVLFGTKYAINSSNTCISWDDGNTCTCSTSPSCNCGNCAKILDNKATITYQNNWTFTLTFNKDSGKFTSVSLTSNIQFASVTVENKTISSDKISFTLKGQKVANEYKYETRWDYSSSKPLDGSDEGSNTEPKVVTSGTSAKIVDLFEFKRLSGKVDFVSLFAEITDESGKVAELDVSNGELKYAEMSSDGKTLVVNGAPNGGKEFFITVHPFGKSNGMPKATFKLRISNSFEFIQNNKSEENNEGKGFYVIPYSVDSGDDKNEFTCNLVESGRPVSEYFTYKENGIEKNVPSSFNFDVSDETDKTSLGVVEVESDGDNNVTLKIQNYPQLKEKKVVVKITNGYGFVDYLRFIVSAKTPVGISNKGVEFNVGDKIEWTETQQFPIEFKSDNDTTIETSFYSAELNETDGKFSDNTDGSSLMTTTEGEETKFHGVQPNRIITKTVDEGKDTQATTYYIPYIKGQSIDFDLYKLAKVSEGAFSGSYSSYKNGYNFVSSGGTIIDETGAFSPSPEDNGTECTISIYKGISPTGNPVAKFEFKLLVLTSGDTLYWAGRETADVGYTFEYEIDLGNGNIVDTTDCKTITNKGNAQVGVVESIDTTLTIKVKSGNALIDTIDVGIKLKFPTHPSIGYVKYDNNGYEYVGLGDNIEDKLNSLVKDGKLVLKGSDGQPIKKDNNDYLEPSYYTVLGNEVVASSLQKDYTAQTMKSGTLTENLDYNIGEDMVDGKKILTLKLIQKFTKSSETEATTTNYKTTINNIEYMCDMSENGPTLTIGYKNIKLKYDGNKSGTTICTYVENDINYRVYKTVKRGTPNTITYNLEISKQVDSSGEVTINNKRYKVTENEGGEYEVSYETLYESIYLVWKYENVKYWGEWKYRVVDKFNKVTKEGNKIDITDGGTFNVKLDWVADGWRFNANTWKLINTATKTEYPVSYKSTIGENGYYVIIDETEYKIVYDSEAAGIKFRAADDISQFYPDSANISDALTLKEETTTNSSWADAIILTGLDGQKTTLTQAYGDKKRTVNIGGSEYLVGEDNKVTIDGKEYVIEGNQVTIGTTPVDAATVLKIMIGGTVVDQCLDISEDEGGSSLNGKTFSITISYNGIDGKKDLKYEGYDIQIKFGSMTF